MLPSTHSKTVYFFSSVDEKNGFSSARKQCQEDELKNLSLMELKQILEQWLDYETVCRLYYFDTSYREINIENDSKLKEMWDYFNTISEAKIFFDYERTYIINYLHKLDYENVTPYLRGEKSYLFTALCKGENVMLKITIGDKKEDTKREVGKVMLLENHPNIITSGRLIDFYDAFSKLPKSYMGYEMVFYPYGDLSKVAKPLSEISFLVLAMRMSSILQFLQQMEHVHYDLKLPNFLIGSKITKGCDIIYDPILIDLEYTHSLASLMKEKDERLSKSKIQYSEFCKDLIDFGDCLLALFKLGDNWENHKAIEELISKIRNSKPVKNQPSNQTDIPKETFLSIKKILKVFTTLAFKVRPEVAVDYIDFSLTMNKKFMQKLININPIAFKSAHETLRKDIEFVKTVLKIDPHLLKYVHDDLKDTFQFMAKYVRKDGLLLQYASDSLKRNPEFVKVATDETVCAIMYVNEDFKGYEGLLRACLMKQPFLLEYALEKKKSKDIVMCAISKDPMAIRFANKEFVNDPDIQQILEEHKSKEADLDQQTQTRFFNWDNCNLKRNPPAFWLPKSNIESSVKEPKDSHKHARNGLQLFHGNTSFNSTSSSPSTPIRDKKRHKSSKIGQVNP